MKTVLAVLCAAVLGTGPAGAPAQSDGKAHFAALAAAFIADQYRFEPVSADQAGITTYGDRLADRTPRGHAAQIAAFRAWRGRFAAVPGAVDDPDTASDRRAVLDAIDQTLIEDELLAPWQHDPAGYVGDLGAAFFLPFVRTGESADARFGHIAKRLALVSAYVDAAIGNLSGATSRATSWRAVS